MSKGWSEQGVTVLQFTKAEQEQREQNLADYGSKVAKLDAEVQALEIKKKNLSQVVIEAFDKEYARIHDFEQSLDKRKAALDKQESELATLKAELQKRDEELKAESADFDEFIKKEQAKHEIFKAKLESLQAELNLKQQHLDESNFILEAALADATTNNVELRNKISNLKSREEAIVNSETSLAQKQAEAAELIRQAQAAVENNRLLQLELNKQIKLAQDKQAQADDLSMQYHKYIDMAIAEKDSYEAKNAKLDERTIDIDDKLSSARKIMQEADLRIAKAQDLETKITKLKEEYKSITKET